MAKQILFSLLFLFCLDVTAQDIYGQKKASPVDSSGTDTRFWIGQKPAYGNAGATKTTRSLSKDSLGAWIGRIVPSVIDTNNWHTDGNSGTDPAVNFVGTNDTALHIRSNNKDNIILDGDNNQYYYVDTNNVPYLFADFITEICNVGINDAKIILNNTQKRVQINGDSVIVDNNATIRDSLKLESVANGSITDSVLVWDAADSIVKKVKQPLAIIDTVIHLNSSQVQNGFTTPIIIDSVDASQYIQFVAGTAISNFNTTPEISANNIAITTGYAGLLTTVGIGFIDLSVSATNSSIIFPSSFGSGNALENVLYIQFTGDDAVFDGTVDVYLYYYIRDK